MKCIGCGVEAESLPWVGVGLTANEVLVEAAIAAKAPIAEITRLAATRVGAPVCDKCQQDPAHRTRPLKLHFHRADAAAPAGPDQGVGLPSVASTAAVSAPGAKRG